MRRRILVTIVVIAAAAVIGFGVPLGVAVYANEQSSARLELQREASAASTVVPADYATSGDQVELPGGDADTAIGLYDTSGVLVAGEGPTQADPVVASAMTGQPAEGTAGGDIVATVPVSVDEQVVGVIRAARPESTVRHQIIEAWGLMIALGIVVVASAAAVATWQVRRLTRPLERLTGAAQRLGGGDFTIDTPRTGMPEIDDAGRALERTADRLGSMIERERRFSADVSHQLRTPLTALRLDLDNAVTTPGVDTTAAIHGAFEAIDRMEATIDDLITLRRDASVDGDGLDLVELLAEVEETWRGPLADDGRPLRVQVPAGSGPVAVSAAAVRQILAVLVANAVEHGAGTVRITGTVGPTDMTIEVADDGPGLAVDPELVFNRRADRASNRGIGLPLARSLAEAEGGRLDYRADPHPTFTLRLPLPAPDA